MLGVKEQDRKMTQFKDILNVETDTDTYTLVGRPCELSAFSFVPKERNVQKERTVFNSEKKVWFYYMHCLH